MESSVAELNALLEAFVNRDQYYVLHSSTEKFVLRLWKDTPTSLEDIRVNIRKGRASRPLVELWIRNLLAQVRSQVTTSSFKFRECVRLERFADLHLYTDLSPLQRKLFGIVDTLWCSSNAEHFKYPVTDEIAPDYSKMIKNPICLADMYARIRGQPPVWPHTGSSKGTPRAYQEDAELRQDILLLEKNCLEYNDYGDEFTSAAKSLKVESTRLFSGRHTPTYDVNIEKVMLAEGREDYQINRPAILLKKPTKANPPPVSPAPEAVENETVPPAESRKSRRTPKPKEGAPMLPQPPVTPTGRPRRQRQPPPEAEPVKEEVKSEQKEEIKGKVKSRKAPRKTPTPEAASPPAASSAESKKSAAKPTPNQAERQKRGRSEVAPEVVVPKPNPKDTSKRRRTEPSVTAAPTKGGTRTQQKKTASTKIREPLVTISSEEQDAVESSDESSVEFSPPPKQKPQKQKKAAAKKKREPSVTVSSEEPPEVAPTAGRRPQRKCVKQHLYLRGEGKGKVADSESSDESSVEFSPPPKQKPHPVNPPQRKTSRIKKTIETSTGQEEEPVANSPQRKMKIDLDHYEKVVASHRRKFDNWVHKGTPEMEREFGRMLEELRVYRRNLLKAL